MNFRISGFACAAFIFNSAFAGAALAGDIVGFDFPVKTYANDGAIDEHQLTAENLGIPFDSIEIVAVRPNYKLIQIKVGEDFFNVRVEKVKFKDPARYASLGKGVSWICPGAGSRQPQPPIGSYSTRGLGVSPVCP